MYVVTDAQGNHLTEPLDHYPSAAEQWQAWDMALPLPAGHYPRVRKV